MSMQGGLSINRMCRLADVSRGGFYRSCEDNAPLQDEMQLKAGVQEIVLEHRQRYGYRRVAAELRRRGIIANHKRIARIMREDNLLNLQRLFDTRNQNSEERFEVYLNLAA
jgi:putative transposase